MEFEDGKGRGNSAGVNNNGEVEVFAITEDIGRHQNRLEQKAWTLPFKAIDPVDSNDYFVYIKNAGTKLYSIPLIQVRSTVVGAVEAHYVTGTPSYTADTDITPVNKTVGVNKSPEGSSVFKTDTNTTGLTNQGILAMIRCAVANTDYFENDPTGIFVPPGQAVALLWDTATGIISGKITLVQVSDLRD